MAFPFTLGGTRGFDSDTAVVTKNTEGEVHAADGRRSVRRFRQGDRQGGFIIKGRGRRWVVDIENANVSSRCRQGNQQIHSSQSRHTHCMRLRGVRAWHSYAFKAAQSGSS